jgi:hypothetical protein
MHVTAFTAAVNALLANDAATATGLPMVSCPVSQLSVGLQVPTPILISVWARAGEDFDPHFYIVARDPDGEMKGRFERLWHWPDTSGKPFKFQVFTEYLQLIVRKEGFYTIGLYDEPDQTETDIWFPLEIYVSSQAPPPGPLPPRLSTPDVPNN